MSIKEIEAKSLLRKQKHTDSWFVSRYGMNLYRGCTHNCVYCDGRAEKYNVTGEFGCDIEVKINAPQLLKNALDPKRKRKPMKKGFILAGGGVGDSYQPIEKKYNLTRSALQIIEEYNFPVQTLTKSPLITRDLDILQRINTKSGVIAHFSFSSVDEETCRIFEPGLPSPAKRLEALAALTEVGIPCGIFLMPVIPLISDTLEKISETIKAAMDAGAKYVVFGGMTLKPGRQMDYFYQVLDKQYPGLKGKYDIIYKDKNHWGQGSSKYYNYIQKNFNDAIKQFNIPMRIPPELYNTIIEENDLVIVILEHIDYILKQRGQTTPYGFAARSISKLDEPISLWKNNLTKIKGVGNVTERIIQEILETGDSNYYKQLRNNR